MDSDIKISKFEIFLLILIITFSENTFYIISSDSLRPSGVVHFDDLGIGLVFVFIYVVYRKYKNIMVEKYKFKWMILFIFILVLIGSLQSYWLYGQPILLGIRPQRFFLSLYLMYFPIYKMMKIHKNFNVIIQKILFYIGGFELVLYISQYLLMNHILFLQVKIGERFGGSTMAIGSSILLLLPFFVMNNIINNYKLKTNTIFLFALLFFHLIVVKTRLVAIAIVASFLIIFILLKRPIKQKLLLVIFGLMCILLIEINSPVIQSYLKVLNSDYISGDNNARIRAEGKQFYLKQLKQSPILGRGFINILFRNAYIHSGIDKKYFFNDNGVVAFYFFYGLFGVVWIIILFVKLYYYSINAYIKNKNYIGIGVAIFMSILLPNILFLYWNWGGFYVAIILALVEANSDKNIEGNKFLLNE